MFMSRRFLTGVASTTVSEGLSLHETFVASLLSHSQRLSSTHDINLSLRLIFCEGCKPKSKCNLVNSQPRQTGPIIGSRFSIIVFYPRPSALLLFNHVLYFELGSACGAWPPVRFPSHGMCAFASLHCIKLPYGVRTSNPCFPNAAPRRVRQGYKVQLHMRVA